MEVSSSLVAGKRVLLIWHGGSATEAVQDVVGDLRQKAGGNGEVLLEHAQRLLMGEPQYQASVPQVASCCFPLYFCGACQHASVLVS